MATDTITIGLLLFLNVLLYAFLVLGALKLRGKRKRYSHARDVDEAFALLEQSLRESFPDLPQGFTWHEAILRLRNLNTKANWHDIENTLGKYEAYRFGGTKGNSDIQMESVLRLAQSLPRGKSYALGHQETS